MQFKPFGWAAVPAALLLALQPGSAQAQAWIGQIVGNMIAAEAAAQQEHACMTGTAMPENEVAEARGPALALMPRYFEAAKGGGAALSSFYNLDKRSRWTSGGTSAGMADIDRQRDPFAQGGLVLDPVPLGFVRAGDGASALGQWNVRNAMGKAAGTYTALFTRKTGVWRLSALELTPARSYVDPVVQYCHKAGDVLPYRIANARWSREYAEKRVAKAEAKAQRAEASAAAARAKAEKSPKSSSAQAALQEAEVRAKDMGELLEARRKELAEYQAIEAAANADLKAAEGRKAAAIAALAAGE
jgi:hypothetical protein